MKTVLRDRTSNVPDGIDPRIQRWMQIQNSDNNRDHQDLEDEFAKIGAVKKWTPVLTFATPGNLAVTYATAQGDLIRTKEGVIATFRIVTSAFSWTTASGNLEITGLPYSASLSSADSGYVWHGSLVFQGITKANYTQFTPQIDAGDSFIKVTASGSGVAAATLVAADFPSGGTVALSGNVAFRIRS